ncbi:MAG TPA: hypothetical protein PLL30_05130 [Candidatus Krumholzibacteria bacterium]|nr:hypothetical protein [Candidatus Krumholzibacteria bacterium]HPD71146.1 hypothetical protein [Candidatus Krumholzibacteria bacterium]HRY39154.1 hypothetical protein [Candidatus Krumholzibacteria bacterium]
MRVVAATLLIALIAGCRADEAPDGYAAWRELLAAELDRTGADDPADLYKFLFQGVMGPAHAVDSAGEARRRLQDEWDAAGRLAPAGRPPLFVALRPDGRLVRVDLVRLRHLVAAEGPAAGPAALDTLAAAFTRTARRWRGDPDQLAALWSAAVADSALWRGRVAPGALRDLDREVRGVWPLIHHSARYAERWAPHYRVVEAALLPAVWLRAGGRP